MRMMRLVAWATAVLLGATGAALARVPENWGMGLLGGPTPVAERLDGFHDLLLVIISAIALFVLALLIYVSIRFNAKRNPTPSRTTHNTLVEVAWTIIPVLILLTIAVPSFRTLYYGDRTFEPEMTLVVHGEQFQWRYDYPDQQIADYYSFLVQDADLKEGQPRLLTADPPVILPVDTNVQVLVTSDPTGVIHAWALPAAAIKTDAVPGHTNETWLRFTEEGVFYGQCSELCGDGHGFMPIEVHVVSRAAFNEWAMQNTTGAEPKLLALTPEDEDAIRNDDVAALTPAAATASGR